MLSTSAGGSRHSHEASTTKEAAGGTEGGASDHTGNSITVNIVWQKKNFFFVKKETPKGTQAALQLVGLPAQKWPALLGSHCRRRTMDGSLLAPRMNSSRESFPRKQEDR